MHNLPISSFLSISSILTQDFRSVASLPVLAFLVPLVNGVLRANLMPTSHFPLKIIWQAPTYVRIPSKTSKTDEEKLYGW